MNGIFKLIKSSYFPEILDNTFRRILRPKGAPKIPGKVLTLKITRKGT